MVDVIQIPNLPAATSLEGSEQFEIVQGGVSKRADINQIGGFLGAVMSVNGQTGAVVVTKGDVGLGNVDNTSDANKPVSTAQQTALNLKANLASPTFTGTVSGITKAMVGLGNVDNTSDANKPVSTAQQTALNLKADLASPTFTGTVNGITKAMVGLGNVDNTSDANKPVSTATQTALNLKLNAQGTTTNNNAPAGDIGEYVESVVLAGSAVSLTSGISSNVTSISLTAGDWDVSGNVFFATAASTSTTAFGGSISTVSATAPTRPGGGWFELRTAATVLGATQVGFPTGTTRISIASTTTVYLLGFSNFTVSTCSAYGTLRARRVR